ncbi:branched-chain amino acid ABC transporter permease [Yinghuangia seranimata]|uniref:branched-chain amino acid ABC transporter permease n=1 Tax=Yinghuangia seranimata TaxID=408067 RepID=UPI00248BC469|nr:branched-chain amino acid ABC transporter permease [Yinghuangia seranimata]MDI2126253.1 branched-chain amino acid ABC transporter permease [Yinghuangia seranimata]
MTVQEFWDYLIPGIALGALYAVIAIGYTMVYGVLQLINFAHSEVFMVGGFAVLMVFTKIDFNDPSVGMSVLLVLLGFATAGFAGAGTAFALEKVAYRPLRKRNAPRLAFLISAIGASFLLSNLAGKLFGRNNHSLTIPFENKKVFTVMNAQVTVLQVLIVCSAVIMMIGLDLLVNRTKMGAGIRAVAQDAETAGLMGVDIDKVISRTFIVGGLLGGIAGFLFAMNSSVGYTMGFFPGITAFAAAVVGGIGNVRGAMLGGLLLGLVESFSSPLFGEEWRYVSAFVVLILVLMFRPTGILGERLGRTA